MNLKRNRTKKNNINKKGLNNNKGNDGKNKLKNRKLNHTKKEFQESKKGCKRNSSVDKLKNRIHNYNDLNKDEKDFNYIDEEINSLNFEEAIRVDHRSYCVYYFSLLRSKHILISSFCYFNNYNAQIIKIYMFFFIFMINYVVSLLFYSDNTMNKIFIDDGIFDFTYQLPKMFYSFIVSVLLKGLLNNLGLCENSIIAIKKKIKERKGYKNKIFCLKIKLILFFIINSIILSYLGCFCVVYTNTQVYLLKETLSSFTISIINPFFIYLIPGIFRIRALDKKRKILFQFSKVLQIL